MLILTTEEKVTLTKHKNKLLRQNFLMLLLCVTFIADPVFPKSRIRFLSERHAQIRSPAFRISTFEMEWLYIFFLSNFQHMGC